MKFENRYSRADRVLHDIAFRAGQAQQALADVEDLLYGDTFRDIPLERPVFITALPRSGTTILLQLLWETGSFATHIYRDMPFVLCPLMWNRFSKRFRVRTGSRERAHGDGLEISGESPEAFEEMIWKRFWPSHYLDDRIEPWEADDQNSEFDAFFENHMRKIIALRRSDSSPELRYLSKNNLNIARLAAPPEALRRGIIVIPFRDPVQHAASMRRQHRRFMKLHEEDDFIRRYMAAIGHHEFGQELRPVDFGGWVDQASDPDGLEFWVRYWTAAYKFVLEHGKPSSVLVSYARLTEEPEASLRTLSQSLEIPEDRLVARAGSLHPPREHAVDPTTVRPSVLSDARALFEELELRSASL